MWKWVLSCVSSARYSIIINGTVHGYIRRERGLRQGDPISPLLFNFVGEVLCALFTKRQEEGWISGMEIRNIKIPILQFADDTLILCEGMDEGLIRVKALIILFELVPGQNIKWTKSGILGINCDDRMQAQAAAVLGCSRITLPSNYLGLPLFRGRVTKSIWQPVIDRCQRRLEAWKGQIISQAGRATLIKATLAGIPNYWTSLVPCPIRVAKKIEAIQLHFLWCGTSDKFKYPLVQWKVVCKAKDDGGMGIKELKGMSSAMLEKESLWRRLVAAKYGSTSSDWLPKRRVVTSAIRRVVLA